MTNVPVYIIVVLYNSADTLPVMLDSLLAQDFQDWRAVLIDNASSETADPALPVFSDPRLDTIRNTENVGFARAVNQGLRLAVEAGAERCVLLNPDTVLPPGFLRQFVGAWTVNDWPVVAPRIMSTEDPTKSWYAGGYLDYGWVFGNRHDEFSEDDPCEPRSVDFASGCCLGISVQTLRAIGLLDESFFVYWEDTDFCLRLKAAGIPITYLRDPFLLHEGGASSGGMFSPSGTKLFYSNYALILRKHFGFREAARMVLRLLRREYTHRHDAPGHFPRVAWSLWRGMWFPIRREPRLSTR